MLALNFGFVNWPIDNRMNRRLKLNSYRGERPSQELNCHLEATVFALALVDVFFQLKQSGK